MKKLGVILLSVMVICCYSCDKNVIEENDKEQIVNVCFGVKFTKCGSMSRSVADDTYIEFYNKYIQTKELVKKDYVLTIMGEDGTLVAEINGEWDITTIQLPSGKYRVVGESSSGRNNYSIVSLKFDEIINVQSSETISLTAQYDCYLLLFPKNNGVYNYKYSLYSSDPKDMPTYDDVCYMFLNDKHEVINIMYSNGVDNTKINFGYNDFGFQNGYFYYFNIVNGTFNIPQMENGGI